MVRQKVRSGVEVEWTLVSATRPCTICGGHHGCRRGFAGEFASCTSVLSEWPLTHGGWIHRIDRLAAAGEATEASAQRPKPQGDEALRTGSSR